MRAAVDDIGNGIASGAVQSILVVVEIQGEALPRTALLGRYGRDPYRALAAIERARCRVNRMVDRIERIN